MARINIVLIYEPDERFYVTRESAPPRSWYRLWRESYVLRETTALHPDELRLMIEAERLDPLAWREPTEEERRPSR